MIRPINNHILIEPVKFESFMASDRDVYEEVGVVIDNGGQEIIKKGDKVFFDSYLAAKFPKNDKEFFWLVRFEDIRAVDSNEPIPK